ncbi:hypothetical protein Q8F55_005660 [Vanrija albida]|uniref:Mediator of RNA polymerase II transcription subunit 7 n=1 Tax=Vanrija albida TaxID=181172 RepID=A0ABR3Q2G6_9TREE
MAQPDAGVPITNTLFPPPPGYYKAFTPAALERLAELEGPAIDAHDAGPSNEVEASASGAPAEPGELEALETSLKPPRADWVLEDGRWMAFGQMYTAEPHIATAREIGLPPLVSDPVSTGGDAERAALPALLQSFLHTLVALLDVLTGTARIPGELELTGRASEGDQYIQHLSNLAATMMVSANQLRGVQAEATLVMLMEKQLAERREQTAKLRAKCREVAATVERLKKEAAGLTGADEAEPAEAEAEQTEEPDDAIKVDLIEVDEVDGGDKIDAE